MPRAPGQLDCLVVGLARSGTTLLTNLLTNRGESRVCLAEPRLTTRRPYRPDKQDYFRRLGFPDPINTRTVAEHLLRQSRAGVKEVRARHIAAALRRFDPARIILVTRDARAALASYHEKNAGSDSPRSRRRFPAKLFLRTAPLLLDLCQREKHRLIVVRYEDFVADPAIRGDLADRLDWPLDGDLALYGALNRAGESGKHDNAISTKSLRRPAPTDPATLATLTPILRRLANYQRAFNYPDAWPNPDDERSESQDRLQHS
ncbi:MAG: sulfotransferase domain-containing protein [Phycisphaeraceae bacterium]|nr:sulfotransferase domain-containing protein [Phycisphaeraceae bacterium]MCB9848111.1 sulfotransferase domain-containing protein [Phycisphaeraceae bacterium]